MHRFRSETRHVGFLQSLFTGLSKSFENYISLNRFKLTIEELGGDRIIKLPADWYAQFSDEEKRDFGGFSSSSFVQNGQTTLFGVTADKSKTFRVTYWYITNPSIPAMAK